MDDYIGLDETLINDVCIQRMGQKLDEVFGFKVGQKRKNGKNFYEQCYEITNHENVVVGDLCIGGQANSILVMLSGQGCMMGDYGWQNRLYNFLRSAQGAKITRLDLAHDDYEGTYLDIDDLNERESMGSSIILESLLVFLSLVIGNTWTGIRWGVLCRSVAVPRISC